MNKKAEICDFIKFDLVGVSDFKEVSSFAHNDNDESFKIKVAAILKEILILIEKHKIDKNHICRASTLKGGDNNHEWFYEDKLKNHITIYQFYGADLIATEVDKGLFKS